MVAMVSKIINNTNCGDIIKIINNKSCRESEQLLSVYRPVPKVRDRIKVISVLEEQLSGPDTCACEQTGKNGSSGADGDAGSGDQQALNNSSAKTGISSGVEPGKKSVGGLNNKPGKKVILKNKYELRFMAGPGFMDKLEKIKSLLSNKFPTGITLEELFDITMDEYLEKHDPKRRIVRRNKKNRAGKNSRINRAIIITGGTILRAIITLE